MTGPLAALTPAGYLHGLLGRVMHASVAEQPHQIAEALITIGGPLADMGRPDLSTRLDTAVHALRLGDYQRGDWAQSRLYGELAAIHAGLDRGDSFEAVLKPAGTHFTSITARTARVSVGPTPKIEWKKFGSPEHPAPNPPSASVVLAGKRLSYFFFYVSAHAGHGESEGAVERFFDISPDLRRRIRDGLFAPKALGQFPSSEAVKLIAKAAGVEPLYGKLMKQLLLQVVFESQDWSLGLPAKDAAWSVFLLYGLRRHAAKQLLTEEGKKKVLEDKALIRVAHGLANLEAVNWHPGRTRREIFEAWLLAMSPKGERLEEQRRFIGEGILRSLRWAPPPPEASDAAHLQWRLRCWIAHHHYGAIPARGLPYPPATILGFALALRPTEVSPEFRDGLETMTRNP